MSEPGVQPLEDLLDQVESIAPLPHVATRVIQVGEDERFSAYDLASIIATDTAMTAKILRLANSAYYGFPRRISTVRDAVVLIGFRAVRATAIAAAVVDMFNKDGDPRFHGDLVWAHSVACASVAEVLAKRSRDVRPDEAFSAGILHDLGRLVLSQYARAPFARALDRATQEPAALETIETEIFGYDHAEVGAALARRWSFPTEVSQAIAEHHDAASPTPLVAVLARANQFCRDVGLWCGLDTEDGARAFGPWDGDAPAAAPAEPDPEVSEIIKVDLMGLVGLEARVRHFLSSSRNGEQRWYSAPTTDTDAAPQAGDRAVA